MPASPVMPRLRLELLLLPPPPLLVLASPSRGGGDSGHSVGSVAIDLSVVERHQ